MTGAQLAGRKSGLPITEVQSEQLRGLLAVPPRVSVTESAHVCEIHLVCRNRRGVTEETSSAFSSGVWTIAAKHARPGVRFALHQEKGEPSYLQGTITSSSRIAGRVRLRVERSQMPTLWRGGSSSEKGYLWDGQDFSCLPHIGIAIDAAAVGGNAPIKWLREAKTWSYPRADALRTRLAQTSNRPTSARQALFERELTRVAAMREDRSIPYTFVDAAGLACGLDDGAIQLAIGHGVLQAPDRKAGLCTTFYLTAAWARRQRALIRDVSDRGGRGKARATPDRKGGTETDPTGGDPFADGSLENLSADEIRQLVWQSVVLREGQGDFRRLVLTAYNGRCAITGCNVQEALDAAHIIPHSKTGKKGMHVANGLLLRSDVHALLDRQLIALRANGETVTVHASLRLKGTPYARLDGRILRLPKSVGERPSRALLTMRESRMPLL